MIDLSNTPGRVIPFPKPKLHYAGFLLNRFAKLAGCDPNGITVDQHQQNGAHGVHQARVRLHGDDTIYRLILAPESAPFEANGAPIDQHFAKPLGGGE